MNETIKEEIVEWIKIIITALFFAFIITRFIKPTLVNGESMYPTLKSHDYLVANRMTYKLSEPKCGDIMIFKTDLLQDDGRKKELVKRVIGVPGDHLKISDSKVYINGKLLNEVSYIHDNYTEGDIDMVIPKGKVFAMGDNREVSLDSRYKEVGLVDEQNIKGKVILRVFPFSDIGIFE